MREQARQAIGRNASNARQARAIIQAQFRHRQALPCKRRARGLRTAGRSDRTRTTFGAQRQQQHPRHDIVAALVDETDDFAQCGRSMFSQQHRVRRHFTLAHLTGKNASHFLPEMTQYLRSETRLPQHQAIQRELAARAGHLAA